MRDDFPTRIKGVLAARAGHLCSNPECQRPTSGPNSDPAQAINVGVASHISAASPGGPRFNPSLTPKQRQSVENGIWLCQQCGSVVDSDEGWYPVKRLLEWKQLAEDRALKEIESILPHISNLNHISESSDRPHHQHLCGCERDKDAPEVSTLWVRNKTSHFSSLSTVP
jgi:hypothetical protein